MLTAFREALTLDKNVIRFPMTKGVFSRFVAFI